jgi:multisubunit Na+/H+ antiporter MnhB subunit
MLIGAAASYFVLASATVILWAGHGGILPTPLSGLLALPGVLAGLVFLFSRRPQRERRRAKTIAWIFVILGLLIVAINVNAFRHDRSRGRPFELVPDVGDRYR